MAADSYAVAVSDWGRQFLVSFYMLRETHKCLIIPIKKERVHR